MQNTSAKPESRLMMNEILEKIINALEDAEENDYVSSKFSEYEGESVNSMHSHLMNYAISQDRKINKLQQKLDIAVEAFREIMQLNYLEEYGGEHYKIINKALKQIKEG